MRDNGTVIMAAAATMFAGFLMAFQSRANGSLSGVLGSSVYAATASFLGGLVIMAIALLVSPSARRGIVRLVDDLSAGQVRWWMLLGGLAGTAVVLAQALTVPLIGVSILTMSFVCGQLLGALVVDSTSLPPGGTTPLSLLRFIGTLIVLAGVVLASWGGLDRGIPLWAPFIPMFAGSLTSVQAALNGRVRLSAGSSIAATSVNFLVGSLFLIVCSGVVWALGSRMQQLPAFPGQMWMLAGGALGVVFIAVTSTTVHSLGVLLVSMTSLFGNLASSLLVDLAHPAAAVTPTTLVAMLFVLAGVVVASWPQPGGPPRSSAVTPPAGSD